MYLKLGNWTQVEKHEHLLKMSVLGMSPCRSQTFRLRLSVPVSMVQPVWPSGQRRFSFVNHSEVSSLPSLWWSKDHTAEEFLIGSISLKRPTLCHVSTESKLSCSPTSYVELDAVNILSWWSRSGTTSKWLLVVRGCLGNFCLFTLQWEGSLGLKGTMTLCAPGPALHSVIPPRKCQNSLCLVVIPMHFNS